MRYSGGGSLMLWGTFSFDGTVKLEFVSGCRNALDYTKMLTNASLNVEGACLCGNNLNISVR